MAEETLYATKGYTEVIRWVDPSINIDSYIVQMVDNGGGATTAAMVVGCDGETQGYIDPSVESDVSFLGICLGPTIPPAAGTYDLDDTLTAGETVNVLRPTGGRTIVACILASHASSFAIEEGDYLRVGDQDGHLESFVFGENADSTDSFEIVIGKSADDKTTHATEQRVIHVWY